MKYLCIIIAIALLIVGIILIVSKAKGKVVDNKVQRNVGRIIIGIIMCIVSIAYFIGCYTYTTNNYDRLLTTKSDLSKRVTMMMSNYDFERYFFCKCFVATVALISMDKEVPYVCSTSPYWNIFEFDLSIFINIYTPPTIRTTDCLR